jgi:hypothetical protein
MGTISDSTGLVMPRRSADSPADPTAHSFGRSASYLREKPASFTSLEFPPT